ncbi:MAG: hypothetical protein IBX70_14250 [Clostridia bacterium]|nr:hypothetical protein [Clostridia bacterium]
MNKKVMCVIMVLMLSIILIGCKSNDVEAKIEVLSAEELEFFNGDSFFNGEEFNIRNQLLSSVYDGPESIDLFGLFYAGSGLEETITDEELLSVMAASGISGTINQLPSPCEKNSLSNMDAILMEHMDITVEESGKIGLENMVYLEDYDAYYYFHGDTNYRSLITFNRGEREGNQIRLYYDDGFFGDGAKVLTLMEIEGEYKFKSNQYVKSED